MEKFIYKGNVLSLSIVPKKYPESGDFEKVYVKSSVHVIPLINNEEILMIDEDKEFDGRGRTLRIIAGIIENNEEPLAAAKREAEEEAGLLEGNWELFYTAKMQGTINYIRYYFIVRNFKEGKAKPELGEKIYGTQKLKFKELAKRALSGELGTSPSSLVVLKLAEKFGIVKI